LTEGDEGMERKWRLMIYGVLGATLVLAALAAPAAWNTSGQAAFAQTVPTRTPTDDPNPPTEPPPPPTEPPATPQPVPATPPPAASPTVAPTAPAGAADFAVTLAADRRDVWPGATVTFTLTVVNTGQTALRQVVVEDVLPDALQPGQVISGVATWQGRTLRATAASLPVGARLVVVYTGRVGTAQPGQAITSRVTATAEGGVRKTATFALGLPPSELPITGGRGQQ
jgi:uncharacterized repeat protein (TIGR01451 family)